MHKKGIMGKERTPSQRAVRTLSAVAIDSEQGRKGRRRRASTKFRGSETSKPKPVLWEPEAPNHNAARALNKTGLMGPDAIYNLFLLLEYGEFISWFCHSFTADPDQLGGQQLCCYAALACKDSSPTPV